MLPEVTLIAGTAVDWQKFVTTSNNALLRSPTRELDKAFLPVGSIATYVAALLEIIRPGANPFTAIKDAERVLGHLTFTFFVTIDREDAMAMLKQSIGLIVTSAEPSQGRENLIISGNLRDWKTAVIEACTGSEGTHGSRVFYNEIWKTFDKLGFRDVFSKYQRTDLRDQTFALEYRPR